MAFKLPGTSSGAPLLRDVFDIPEDAVDTFVLKLADSTKEDQLRSTVNDYVITDDIAENLNLALGFVDTALNTGNNQGVYLTGSFGSGKSHFMAVLYALLSKSPVTREIPELQKLIEKHPASVGAQRGTGDLLQIPFHFLDSTSIEDTVFRGALDRFSELHPDSPLPILHSSEGLFDDADRMRSAMGDDAFFAGLNMSKIGPEGDIVTATPARESENSAWGAAGATITENAEWNAATYDQARSSSASEQQRAYLATALTETMFSSYSTNSGWLPFSDGLAAISAHAKTLGYEGVVMYLDELILWLTFLISSREHFNREAQKLTLLVENKTGQMAVPMVFFIARQFDLAGLRDSSSESGSDLEARQQAFSHQEGRFHDIVLGNKNLPKIASRRLLSPKDEAAKLKLEDAFNGLKLRPEITNVLLDGINTSEDHQSSNMEQFQLTYPFSPALVDTLVHLSPIMQRERTALKVMEGLLIDKRDSMTIDSVIPVGDAFDRLTAGDKKLHNKAAVRFELGSSFWKDKLRPLILKINGLTPDLTDDAVNALPAAQRDTVLEQFRVGKTLILSTVAPEVPALKQLTASRLAHLNHGSIRSIFSGDTTTRALSYVRQWASEFPEIIIQSEVKDPVLTLKLDDVPWEQVLDKAKKEDTEGRRRNKVKDLLSDSFRISGDKPALDGAYHRTIAWRGTARTVEFVFGNVRDRASLNNDAFVPSQPGNLRVVVDFPFDDSGHTVGEDHQRVAELRNNISSDLFTLVWLPQFLSHDQLEKLGELVILDHLLTTNGWRDYSNDIAEDDREAIRQILKQRQESLGHQIRDALTVVYGAESGANFLEGQAPLQLLNSGGAVAKPVGANLKEATDRLLDSLYTDHFPDHPQFDADRVLPNADYNKVIRVLREAAGSRGGRVDLAKENRSACHAILSALKIALVQDSHIVFNADHAASALSEIDAVLRKKEVDPKKDDISVQTLQNAIHDVNPRRGLNWQTIDVYVAAWAALNDRSWVQDSRETPAPALQQMDPRMILRPVRLPDLAVWDTAVGVYQHLFGEFISGHLSAANLRSLQQLAAEQVAEHREAAQALTTTLGTVNRLLGISGDTQRSRLADETQKLLDAIHRDQHDPVLIVEHLASARTADGRILGASESEAVRSLSTTQEVTRAVRTVTERGGYQITTLINYATSHQDHDEGATNILGHLATALSDHEFKSSAKDAVRRFLDEFAAWNGRVLEKTQPPTQPPAVREGEVPSATGAAKETSTDNTFAVDSPADSQKLGARIDSLLSEGKRIRVIVEIVE